MGHFQKSKILKLWQIKDKVNLRTFANEHIVRNLFIARLRPLENCTFCDFLDFQMFYSGSGCSPVRLTMTLKIEILDQFCTLFHKKVSDLNSTVLTLRYRNPNVHMSEFLTSNFLEFIFFCGNKKSNP